MSCITDLPSIYVHTQSGLKQQDLLDVLSLGVMNNPLFSMKGPAMLQGQFPTAFPLKHQQKDVRLALELG